MTTTVKLKVIGMKCGACANTIKQALSNKNGIVSVDASHRDDSVEVEFDESVLEANIIKFIEEAGYTIKSSKIILE